MSLEGFRPIERSDYLACCANKEHRCWDKSPHNIVPNIADQRAPTHKPTEGMVTDSSSMLDKKLADAVRGAGYHEDETGHASAEKLPADMREVKSLIDAGADIDRCK